jgi:hypothetical protein
MIGALIDFIVACGDALHADALASWEQLVNPHAIVVAAADWTEIAAIAQAGSAAIAVFALIGVWFQLLQNRRQARATRAYEYLERYSSPSEIGLNAQFHEFIKVEPSKLDPQRAHWDSMSAEERSQALQQRQDAQCAKWENMCSEKRFEILHALNFWEELAGMYRRRLVDRRIVRDYFASGAIAYWDWAQWFIRYQRKKRGSERPMKDLEDLCARIDRGREAEARRMTFPYALRRRRRVNR